ncbi:alpha-ketoglutarate-dependent dioxygenase AlkB [Streptomyces sp. DSM 44917]|uniref:Alpha-ketoglutarate-dependent dioxygenase AlkB n=1 Tax=Streptomyces boetiae TaxID=3075541 RepID=A0ABU2L4V7_9ACTN|nr:alpha-ketoglutarate-dependent dioxygenase AlkB [Streptomyces sp. DSM 44917]MDT0306570.1 alpha-ketoglutarate-dependent dioxygenase AlkB [Streptomyces sp. DSM 44917]
MTEELFPRAPREVAAGAVHLPGLLGEARQRELLAACRAWALPPAGLRTVRTRAGVMSVRQVGLGRHWGPVPRCPACGRARAEPGECAAHAYPYAYTRVAHDGDGAPVKAFPAWLGDWAREAVAAAARAGATGLAAHAGAAYDTGLINFYDARARMGMHQDADERSPAPVVSFSLGDACVFRFGTPAGRGRPWEDVELRGGDAFVFGGPSRLAYHGVPRTRPGTAPPWLGLEGRVNVTVRVSGLA